MTENAPDTATPHNALTVYFDGACALCRAEINHYAARPGACALRFVDVSQTGAETGADLSQSAARARFHIRTEDGALVSGARAFIAIWQRLPGWRWLAWVATRPGMPQVLEAGYRAFLPVRPALSRWIGRRLPKG